MGHSIIKIKDKYLIWSTVVDAPITYGMTLGELKDYIRAKYGEEGLRQLPPRLVRVEETDTSSLGFSLSKLISCNRAGEGETHLPLAKLYKEYCENRSD